MSKTNKKISKIDIGISDADRKKISGGLARMLADTYTLYLKTHNFHWNVTGPMFQTLHLMFMDQYNETWLAVDLLAERIRALGYPAPGSYQEFAALTRIKDSSTSINAKEMIQQLIEGQEAVTRTAREVLPVAEKSGDQPTVDLLSARMQIHEKNAWMLRSLLDE